MRKLQKFFYRLENNFSSGQFEEFGLTLFKLRFVIGAVLFFLCVLPELHGSSTGLYAKFL